MASRYYYHTVIIRILLIVITSYLLSISINDWRFIIISSSALIFQIVSLIYFLNHTNRKIAFFFEAIKNDDSTLYFPLITKNRTVKELNASLNDVNELVKRIRHEVQSQEQYYHLLLEQAETGILSIDSKGHIRFSNEAAKNFLQVETLTHVNQFQRIDEGLWEVLKSLQPGEKHHVKFQTERESYDISLKASRIVIKDEPILLVVLQDIHSEIDENETESWIRLIRVLTHEIMNSITPITSLSETLANFFTNTEMGNSDISEEDKMAQAISGLNVIREQSRSLLHFVESYRNLTRLPQPDIQPFEACILIDKLKLLCQSEPNASHVDLQTNIDPPGHIVMGDQEQLGQVLLNIAKNSFEAVSGRVGAKIRIEISASNKGTIIRVMDNGPGISTENLKDIFTPFFTTKESGTGIGLSLSKQIVRNHKGSISARSIPDEETVFTIELV